MGYFQDILSCCRAVCGGRNGFCDVPDDVVVGPDRDDKLMMLCHDLMMSCDNKMLCENILVANMIHQNQIQNQICHLHLMPENVPECPEIAAHQNLTIIPLSVIISHLTVQIQHPVAHHKYYFGDIWDHHAALRDAH